MNKSILRLPLLKLALACCALASPFAAFAQSDAQSAASPRANEEKSNKTHTIAISYNNGVWSYTIQPAQGNPKRAKVKRGDTLLWVSTEGSWTVFFKNGTTPLVNGSGNPVTTVSGPSGNAAGGKVDTKLKPNDSFTYGVKLVPNGGGPEVTDDPEIIIES
jgi:hypothetical protein